MYLEISSETRSLFYSDCHIFIGSVNGLVRKNPKREVHLRLWNSCLFTVFLPQSSEIRFAILGFVITFLTVSQIGRSVYTFIVDIYQKFDGNEMIELALSIILTYPDHKFKNIAVDKGTAGAGSKESDQRAR